MSRMQGAAAGLAAALLLASGALCTPAEQSCQEAAYEARMTALKNLQDDVLALKIADKKTVRSFIESTDLPKDDPRSLLQGAVEFQPPWFYGNGECEVRVALSGETLRKNLKRILEQNYKKEGGEFAKLTFDSVGGKDYVETSRATVYMPQNSTATLTDGLPGWSGKSVRARIAAEYAASQDGQAKLKAEVEKTAISDKMTLADLMAANPLVKETVDDFFRRGMPASKVYYPKGIVEVRFGITYAKLWNALESASQHSGALEQKIDPAVLAGARERTKDKDKPVMASGFAQVDGKAVTPADVEQTAVPLFPTAAEAPAEKPLEKPQEK